MYYPLVQRALLFVSLILRPKKKEGKLKKKKKTATRSERRQDNESSFYAFEVGPRSNAARPIRSNPKPRSSSRVFGIPALRRLIIMVAMYCFCILFPFREVVEREEKSLSINLDKLWTPSAVVQPVWSSTGYTNIYVQ